MLSNCRSGFVGLLTILDEDSLMLGPTTLAQVDLYILKTCGLGRGPMKTSGGVTGWYCSEIKDQVSNCPIEHVGRSIALISRRLVRICIDETETTEAWCCLQSRQRIWISNELRVVIINDR